jgi:hypothetical protein
MPEPRRLSHRSAEYADRYERANHRSSFAHPLFVDAVTDVFGLDIQTWATDDVIVSAWYRRFGPLRRFTHPAFCYYSPVLLEQGVSARDLIATGMRAGASRLQLPPGIRFENERETPSRDFKTYHVSTDALDPSSWSASQRRLFARSREAYRFREGSAAEIVSRSVEAYGRHGRKAPFNERQMKDLVSRLQGLGLVEIHALDAQSSSNEAALAILLDDRTACYWLAGSKPGPAMTVLLGNVFEKLKERGLSLDFLGANTPSIAEFKRRFGGELVSHVHLELESEGAFRSVRRIFSRR